MPFKKSVAEWPTSSTDQPYSSGSLVGSTIKAWSKINEMVRLNDWYDTLPAGYYQLTIGWILEREFTAGPVEFNIQ